MRPDEIEERKQAFERTKLAHDTVKHITTLATGSIVLIATLMDKIPKPVTNPELMMASILALLLCILFATLFFLLVSIRPHLLAEPETRDRKSEASICLAVYVLFLLGIGALAVFATQNMSKF